MQFPRFAFVLFATVLLSACSIVGEGASTLSVSKILIGSEVNMRQEIEEPKVFYAPSDSTFHAHVFVEGLHAKETITGSWWYQPEEQKIFETQVQVTPELPVAKFVLTNNGGGWVPGEYFFIVHHGNKQLYGQSIRVQEEEEGMSN